MKIRLFYVLLSAVFLVSACVEKKGVSLDPTAGPTAVHRTDESFDQADADTDVPEMESLQQPLPEPPEKPTSLPSEGEEVTPPGEVLDRDAAEAALGYVEQAATFWKEGALDEAMSALDEAYSWLLRIEESEDPLAIQEKEDLRLLISKRILEIHAARRTTAVGDLSKAIPLDMNEHVMREIRSFQTRERRFFLESYKRSAAFRPMILEKLRAEGLPDQLSWLPLIESGFKTRALSRARALGLWQFISSTGSIYGLERNQFVDERMDPEKATDGAIAYLQDLHNMFGDWMSALAGYNCGEHRVQRVINRQQINYLDHFWDLYELLPRETARYVPRFLATLIILENPEEYGFELPELADPPAVERITVTRSVRLSDLENEMGLPKDTLKELNPELRYAVTPESDYELRIPAGNGDDMVAIIDRLPKAHVATNTTGVHVVRRGDTLSTIASRYRTSVAKITRLNGLNNQNRIWPGQRLKIPGQGVSVTTRGAVVTSGSPAKTSEHVVRRGENLWVIARRYGVTVGQIKSWNSLKNNRLDVGDRLRIQAGGSSSVYRVKSGDTLAEIAKHHGVSLSALLRANNLTKRSVIYPNQELQLP